MEEAGEHAPRRHHGEGTSCCQLEGAYHTNSHLEDWFFVVFLQWKMITMGHFVVVGRQRQQPGKMPSGAFSLVLLLFYAVWVNVYMMALHCEGTRPDNVEHGGCGILLAKGCMIGVQNSIWIHYHCHILGIDILGIYSTRIYWLLAQCDLSFCQIFLWMQATLPSTVIVLSCWTRGNSTISNQLDAGSIMVRAMKSMTEPSLPLRV